MSRRRNRIGRIVCLAASTCAALLLIPAFDRPSEVAAPPDSTGHYDMARTHMASAEGLCTSTEGMAEQVLSILDGWAARIRAETERHFYRFRRNPAEYQNSEGYFRVLLMAVVLHEDFGVRYNPAKIGTPGEASASDGFFADPRDVFIHGLLGPSRMGTCSSMPVLYVALGRRLGYPLKLVTTKGHLFVRWEAQSERFNIEVTGRGVNRYDDEHYRHWPFELTDEEIAANGYLKSLTPDEEHAVFLSIRAECLREAKRYYEAVTALSEAVQLAPNIRFYRLLLADIQAKAAEHADQTASRSHQRMAVCDPVVPSTIR